MKTAEALPAPAFQPLYRQIKQLLTERLESGEWRPGEPIPSEIELAQRFSVSQGTVRKAVAELAGENVLVRRQGRGTFVASHSHARAHLSFLHVTPDRGHPERLDARLVDIRRVRADAAAAGRLGLPAGAPLVRLRRLLWINGRGPVVLEEARVPEAVFQGLDARMALAHHCMLYSMYEAAFGVKVVAADERLKAVSADARTAAHLGVPAGSALLQIERVAYTYGSKPIELRRGFCNTRFHHYANALS